MNKKYFVRKRGRRQEAGKKKKSKEI